MNCTRVLYSTFEKKYFWNISVGRCKDFAVLLMEKYLVLLRYFYIITYRTSSLSIFAFIVYIATLKSKSIKYSAYRDEFSLFPDWVFRPLSSGDKREANAIKLAMPPTPAMDDRWSGLPSGTVSLGFSGLTCFRFSHNFCGLQAGLAGILTIPYYTISYP